MMIIKVIAQFQQLIVENKGSLIKKYSVSTAKKGMGEIQDSEMTPRGLHQIKVKIGHDCLPNTVFVGRRQTGEIYTPALAKQFPHRDWILTRILWLSGLEPGFNREGHCDSFKRFIYIHGTPDDVPMGIPLSRGCIRMRNADLIEFFDLVSSGTPVLISDFY